MGARRGRGKADSRHDECNFIVIVSELIVDVAVIVIVIVNGDVAVIIASVLCGAEEIFHSSE